LAALLSCDLPFVSPDVLTALVGLLSPGSDAVVPVVSGRRQPLHAVYRVATVEKAGRLALSKGIRSMDGLLGSSLRVTWADDREMAGIPGWRDSCTNVNTPEELARARRRKRG
jgi:molybdopterin-guanine dinucleotide biosynthesis protein A